MAAILITGAAGYIGGLLARRLLDRGHHVVGTDIRPPAAVPGLGFHRADITDRERLARIFQDEAVETLVHLAFYSAPEGDEREARRVNIEGTRTLLDLAARHRLKRLIVPTSTAAYGSHADNPVPLTEESPLRANDWYYYSHHKLVQDELVRSFRHRHPETHTLILRPCALLGPHINNQTGVLLRSPLFVNPASSRRTSVQFIHESDAAAALCLATETEVEGVFNLASRGTVTIPEIAAAAGKRVVHLPYAVVAAFAAVARALRLTPVGPRSLRFGANPIVADGSLFEKATGFIPRHTTLETVRAFYRAPGHPG